jgi:hypothetical protein
MEILLLHQKLSIFSKQDQTLIVALARKLLIALWRLATTGDLSQGIILRPAA